MESGLYTPALTPIKTTTEAYLAARVKQLETQLAAADKRDAARQQQQQEADQQLQRSHRRIADLQAANDKLHDKALNAKARSKSRLYAADDRVSKLEQQIEEYEDDLKCSETKYKTLREEYDTVMACLTADEEQAVMMQHTQRQLTAKVISAHEKSYKDLTERFDTAALEAQANTARQVAARRAVLAELDKERAKCKTIQQEFHTARQAWAQQQSRLVQRISQLQASSRGQASQPDVSAAQQQLAELKEQLQAAQAANAELTAELQTAQQMFVGLLQDSQMKDGQTTISAATLEQKEWSRRQALNDAARLQADN